MATMKHEGNIVVISPMRMTATEENIGNRSVREHGYFFHTLFNPAVLDRGTVVIANVASMFRDDVVSKFSDDNLLAVETVYKRLFTDFPAMSTLVVEDGTLTVNSIEINQGAVHIEEACDLPAEVMEALKHINELDSTVIIASAFLQSVLTWLGRHSEA